MAVQVRMFAALRDAAGTDRVAVAAGRLPDVLEGLAQRFGDTFRRRLAVSSVLVDGVPHRATDPVEVGDGGEIALLPPVSGGAMP